LLITKGYHAYETIEVVERARVLAEKEGTPGQLILQLFGLWTAAFMSSDFTRAAELSGQMMELAEREGNSTSLAFAHGARVRVCSFRGNLRDAETHFERWSGFFKEAESRQFPGERTQIIGHAGIMAAVAGYPDLARKRVAQAFGLASDKRNHYDLISGWFYRSLLSWTRKDPRSTASSALQAIALAEELSSPVLIDGARALLGWANASLGRTAEGVAIASQGKAGALAANTKIAAVAMLSLLAEAQALDGKVNDALATIDEALTINPDEILFLPVGLICRGELRLKVGKKALAKDSLVEAIVLSRSMSAKLYELQAVTSLARILCDDGSRDEARSMLAEIYNWFTEGFDTADLKDAKALLDDLSA
jgi:tetratricopeptide (TPR) repeat protein